MAILKCKMCGGDLSVQEGLSVAQCTYCGAQQTLPKTRDENVANLFNVANAQRAAGEFDKAEETYQKIIELDFTEAEAHWGAVLSRYGIEYVEDSATHKRTPTCHRASYDAVAADMDYRAALQYGDTLQQAMYQQEARLIDDIQRRILAVSQNEPPFDVFICYKETDPTTGQRTEDSVTTNEIYYYLTNAGYKVFYAPITLEDKQGTEYEPYIFAALNSAKVMLAVGSKKEYFEAPWVKNEWSRFLKIIKKDPRKKLFPCYKNMSAYDLPAEFSHLQAQNMGKIGFIADIIQGVKKVLSLFEISEKPKPMSVSVVSKSSTDRKVETEDAISREKQRLKIQTEIAALEKRREMLTEERENGLKTSKKRFIRVMVGIFLFCLIMTIAGISSGETETSDEIIGGVMVFSTSLGMGAIIHALNSRRISERPRQELLDIDQRLTKLKTDFIMN